jgi:tripartite-type tricarboxylate transporter receptor subunit TctC
MHRKPPTRRHALTRLAGVGAAAATLGAPWASALAQAGTIKVLVGYPPGATSDLVARIVAEHMATTLKQTVIVENKPGGGGRIANELVKAAPADGSTLLMTPVATMAIFPHSFAGQLRYDPLKDFAPVAHLSSFHVGIGVGRNVPARTLREYVEWVRADPDKRGFYGSAATGSIPHFFGVMVAKAAGITLTHVPYAGTAPAMQALAAGEISALSTVSADIVSLVRADRARLLAVAGEQRDPGFPDVPTFRELGLDLVALPWYALFAPAGTPTAAVERLSQAAMAAIRDPGVNRRLSEAALIPTGYGAARLGEILKADHEHWGAVIRASGYKPTP